MIAELSKLSWGMSLAACLLASTGCIEPQAAEPYTRQMGNAIDEDDAGSSTPSGGGTAQAPSSGGGGESSANTTGGTEVPAGDTAGGNAGSSGTTGGTPATGTTGASSGAGTGVGSGGTTGGGSSSGTTGGGSTGTPTGPSVLTFKVLTTQLGGNYQPRNIGAIWIEDGSGKFVRTVEIWAERREEHLARFGTASNGNRVDAVASATLSSHKTHTALWNLKDAAGKVVPDGDYQIVIETTDRNGPGDSFAIPFKKSSAPFDKSIPDVTHYKTMSLTFQ